MGQSAIEWPGRYINGKWFEDDTKKDPLTGVDMCKDCWDGLHQKHKACPQRGCQCDCYPGGSNKGLNFAHVPAKGCDEQASLPDVDSIDIR